MTPNPNKTNKPKRLRQQVIAERQIAARRAGPNNWPANLVAYDPFPPRVQRTMIYAENLQLTTNTTVGQLGQEQVFKLNDAFDPAFSASTVQPYGYDQMAALYKRYLVKAVTIEVAVPGRISTTDITSFGLALAAQPSTETAQIQNVQIGLINQQPNAHTMFCSIVNPTTVRKRFLISQLEGLQEIQLNANTSDYSALVTTSPARTPYLRVAVANMCSTSAVNTQILMRVEMEVEFYDRIVLATST